jgi:transcriptional regulator GlxA family with amidase domain
MNAQELLRIESRFKVRDRLAEQVRFRADVQDDVIISRLDPINFRRARWLLITRSMDITAVALETGFASHSHFTTTFKAHLGMTPREFCETYHTE